MWRIAALGVAAVAVVVVGFSLIDRGGSQVSASAVMMAANDDIRGFTRAIAPWNWQFPTDYGAHPRFQTEWWYYTGNLADSAGRRFGYQFTIFRRALAPTSQPSNSEWRVDQIYMAHFTVTDAAGNAFYHDQRYSRGGADLAGATTNPRYRVWLDDWQVAATNADATQTTLSAANAQVAIDFTLEQIKPPALQGDHGLSQKGAEPGNASYYYSLSRLLTQGTLTINGQAFTVSGTTWMDHEFSTQALSAGTQGWDWFGLHLDDGRDLMLGQIRLMDGNKVGLTSGLLVAVDGSTHPLDAKDLTITSTATWTSPHTQAIYPAGWTIRIDPGASAPIELTLTPLIADQELLESIPYWEGAVHITGSVSGYGYAELTGYATPMSGRF